MIADILNTLSTEQLERLLQLHDKHMSAYALQSDVPEAVQARGMAELTATRAAIQAEIEKLMPRH